MVTICPRQSTTARKVRVNADGRRRLRQVVQDPQHVGQVVAQTGRSQRHAERSRPPICNAGSTKGSRSSASASLPIGNDASRKATLTSLVTPPAPTRISRSTRLRELVGELHCHPAAERMAHDGDPLDFEHAEQVAHPVGVRRDRVVGARLVGLPVAQQVGGDDREPLRELGLDGFQVVELSPIP